MGLSATVALSTPAWAGRIDVGSPLVSGQAETFESQQSVARVDLSAEQLQAIYRWLQRHRSGWAGVITPASPRQSEELDIRLTHSDGTTTRISVIAGTSGGQCVLLTGPHTMAYRSFLGILKAWEAMRPLSDQELADLRHLVGAP
jgi:hypothetical protein